MFRIITTARLAALRNEATQVPELQREIDTLRNEAATATAAWETACQRATEAKAAREKDDAEYHRVIDALAAEVHAIKAAADDPVRGETVRAAIALTVLRSRSTGSRLRAHRHRSRPSGYSTCS